MKVADLNPNPREMTVTLHEERASISPFGQPNWRTAFTPNRIAIETTTGAVVQERSDPRASFAGHVMNTRWGPLHLAYFNGYAMWTYLTTPFLMAMPGFKSSLSKDEIDALVKHVHQLAEKKAVAQ